MSLELNIVNQINNRVSSEVKQALEKIKFPLGKMDESWADTTSKQLECAYGLARPAHDESQHNKANDLQAMYDVACYFMTSVADEANRQGNKIGSPLLEILLRVPQKILEDVDSKWYIVDTNSFKREEAGRTVTSLL